MTYVREAVVEKVQADSDTDFRLVPFSKWFSRLEETAQTASEETLQSMVCSFDLSCSHGSGFLFYFTACRKDP
jgi:hypothetical protein